MKYFNRQDYADLLKSISDLNIQKLCNSHSIQTGNIVNLRHDVDDDLQSSVDMARMEAEHGIRSTYFILDTAPYWGRAIKEQLREIHALGHEIGWHNNAISHYLTSGISLANCINAPLGFLNTICPIAGTASHGDPLCYQHGYLNYYVFGLDRVDNLAKFPIKELYNQFKLSDFGLEYEAYFTGHTHYISESGGEWRQNNAEVISDFKENGGKLQILIHPQWWQL